MESTMDLYTKEKIEQIVVMERLHLYNRGIPCGAKTIKNLLGQEDVRPLPSVSTIKRILSRNCLTYGRTGYYPGDENGE
jgi:putative transposase